MGTPTLKSINKEWFENLRLSDYEKLTVSKVKELVYAHSNCRLCFLRCSMGTSNPTSAKWHTHLTFEFYRPRTRKVMTFKQKVFVNKFKEETNRVLLTEVEDFCTAITGDPNILVPLYEDFQDIVDHTRRIVRLLQPYKGNVVRAKIIAQNQNKKGVKEFLSKSPPFILPADDPLQMVYNFEDRVRSVFHPETIEDYINYNLEHDD